MRRRRALPARADRHAALAVGAHDVQHERLRADQLFEQLAHVTHDASDRERAAQLKARDVQAGEVVQLLLDLVVSLGVLVKLALELVGAIRAATCVRARGPRSSRSNSRIASLLASCARRRDVLVLQRPHLLIERLILGDQVLGELDAFVQEVANELFALGTQIGGCAPDLASCLVRSSVPSSIVQIGSPPRTVAFKQGRDLGDQLRQRQHFVDRAGGAWRSAACRT